MTFRDTALIKGSIGSRRKGGMANISEDALPSFLKKEGKDGKWYFQTCKILLVLLGV